MQSVAAIILAGGKSTRLGRDKAAEVLEGRTLLQRAVDAFGGLVDEIVIVKARGQSLPEVKSPAAIRMAQDLFPESGPLGGIYTGLSSTEVPVAIVAGCDMPLLQPALLWALAGAIARHAAAVPLRNGLPEPLCAAYSRSCVDAIRTRLDRGDYKISDLFEEVDTLYLQEPDWRQYDPNGLSFLNVNREEDVALAAELIRRLER